MCNQFLTRRVDFAILLVGNKNSSRCPRQRENREAGVSPARARHCKWGATSQDATAFGWEGAGKRRSTSQETCLDSLDRTPEVRRWYVVPSKKPLD